MPGTGEALTDLAFWFCVRTEGPRDSLPWSNCRAKARLLEA